MGLVEGLLDIDLFVSLDDVTDHDVVVAIDVQTTTFIRNVPHALKQAKGQLLIMDNYL